jgi:hypothetical protein
MDQVKAKASKRMELSIEGVVVIVGNYGSGKTEIAVNLAAHQKRIGRDVSIADLDLVNPYFRTREAREPLTRMGVKVVLPPDTYRHADLPILDPAVAGMIRRPNQVTLLDTGGDDVGATVLASLSDFFQEKPVSVWQVVNPFRPYSDSIEGCLAIRHQIEDAAKLFITGIIGNPNLIDDTSAEHVYKGYDFVCSLSVRSGLPLIFMTATKALVKTIDHSRFDCPVLQIQRQLVPPWKKAVGLAP